MSLRNWHLEKRYERDTAAANGGGERFARNYPRRW
jgi:hypothetical protein